jgi:diadenosine tetraphosphate (Ap4A) HIT family hydrolase
MYRSRKTTKAYNPDSSKKKYLSNQLPCPFCDLDDRTVYKDDQHSMVISNLHPYEYWDKHNVVEHVLLIPKRHVENLNELRDDEKLEIMSTMAEYEANGYSVYWRSQTNATRTVPHQHTHLIKVDNTRTKLSVYSEKPYFVWKI